VNGTDTDVSCTNGTSPTYSHSTLRCDSPPTAEAVIPARSFITIKSEIVEGTGLPSVDAMFSWRASPAP
jgi:hypothetical protein